MIASFSFVIGTFYLFPFFKSSFAWGLKVTDLLKEPAFDLAMSTVFLF